MLLCAPPAFSALCANGLAESTQRVRVQIGQARQFRAAQTSGERLLLQLTQEVADAKMGASHHMDITHFYVKNTVGLEGA